MNTNRSRTRIDRRGFTLIELLVVVLIVVLVSAATLPVVLPALNHRQVSEGARLLQATIAGARDAAIRSNAPRGIRLLPDPAFPGPNPLAANRMIAIEPAPDYSSGRVSVNPTTEIFTARDSTTGLSVTQISLVEAVRDASLMLNEPTSWYWNIRQGDKIRFDDSGRYYTVAGPIQVGPYQKPTVANPTGKLNVERYVNYGAPGYAPGLTTLNPTNPALTQPPSTPNNPNPTAANGHFPERLYLVNGQDDDGDGWVDEGFDGIDNDGDGVVDPGYNGLDDNGNNLIDEPAELLLNGGGEYEPEQFVGSQFTTSFVSQKYTIFRRPVVSEGAREVALPQGVVIDLTTWNAASSVASNGSPSPGLPERSRLPVDPYSLSVDIMIAPNGTVIPSGPGQASLNAGNLGRSPTLNMPFYHFWIAEREDVQPPLWGVTNAVANPNAGNANAQIVNTTVPIANPGYSKGIQYLLPMPQVPMPVGSPNYSPSSLAPNLFTVDPYLKGERRLVTLYVRTGQVLTNEIEYFDTLDTNRPYYDGQFGMRETK